MFKAIHFFKTKGRWIILLLFVLIVFATFRFFEYSSEAYKFSLKVVESSGLFRGETPKTSIRRMKNAYHSSYEEEAFVKLYVVGSNKKGEFDISIKKELGIWCAVSASFDGHEIDNPFPCRNEIRRNLVQRPVAERPAQAANQPQPIDEPDQPRQ